MYRNRSATFLKRRASLGVLLIVAACQTGAPIGGGTGASGSAASLIADLRSENRLPTLATDSKLERAALQQARYMAAAGAMKHTTGWNKDFTSRMHDNGITGTAAENIAEGRMDAVGVISTWMASPPHRRNMLDPRMTRFGLASAPAEGGERRYWAMILSK